MPDKPHDPAHPYNRYSLGKLAIEPPQQSDDQLKIFCLGASLSGTTTLVNYFHSYLEYKTQHIRYNKYLNASPKEQDNWPGKPPQVPKAPRPFEVKFER
eukprot:UN07995